MDSSLWTNLAIMLALLLIMVATSAAGAARPRVNRARMRHMANEGMAGARDIPSLIDGSAVIGSTLTVANTTSVALFAIIGISLGARYLPADQGVHFLAGTLGVLFLVWVQLAGRAAGHFYPDSTLLFLVKPLQAMNLVLVPLTLPLRWLARFVVSVDPQKAMESIHQTDEDLRMIVDAVEEEGSLLQEEREMIHSIFAMGEKAAREIMVPRVDVAAVGANEPLHRVLELVNRRGHSRIPVYDENIDNIVGIVYAKDLLRQMVAGSLDQPAAGLARPPLFIPESKKTDELLREMQGKKVHLAVVLDEYGGTAGIVTIEDLLEEIVGEIQDEYDTEEISIEKVSDSEAVLDARVSVRDMSEALDIELEEGEYDTVGGLVYDRLGKIPVVGDEVRVNGLWITVLSTVGKRIKKVRIRVVELDPLQERSLSG